MSMTEPSLLYKMTLDDRIRGRIKFPRQRKNPHVRFPKSCAAFTKKFAVKKRPSGRWAEEGERKHTCPAQQAKKRLNPQEVQWQKGKRQTKARARANNKTHLPKARVKERFRAKAHNGKTSPSQERARQGTTQERFHRWTSPKRATICAQRKAQVQRQTVTRAKPSFSKHQRHRTQNSNGGMLGQNESDLVNFVSRNNRNIVSCRKLQDLEVQCIIKNCSQHLESESCCENSVDKITRKTQTQKPT